MLDTNVPLIMISREVLKYQDLTLTIKIFRAHDLRIGTISSKMLES
jgi:hypothetical protein